MDSESRISHNSHVSLSPILCGVFFFSVYRNLRAILCLQVTQNRWEPRFSLSLPAPRTESGWSVYVEMYYFIFYFWIMLQVTIWYLHKGCTLEWSRRPGSGMRQAVSPVPPEREQQVQRPGTVPGGGGGRRGQSCGPPGPGEDFSLNAMAMHK